MITVVDYGMGNLRNVRRAFEQVGQQVLVTGKPEDVARAEKLVLPGVGAFGEAIRRIDALGLRASLVGHARQGKLLLGICLGMQLLFDRSEESPGVEGLGILEGAVLRFPDTVKVPHIGWNDVVPTAQSVLYSGMRTTQPCLYFVHSFYVLAPLLEVGSTDYGLTFTSAVEKENILGVQFHPEKSQSSGLEMLRNFAEL